LLDTTTFTWKGSYTPNNLDYTYTAPLISQKSSKAGIIAGSTIGGLLFILLIGGAFWFYRRRRRDSFHATPYSDTNQPTSNQGKPKKFSISSGSTAVELPRHSTGSNFAVPAAGTSEYTHEKGGSALLEERMMDSDIQQTNFVIVPKSPLRVTNPDEGNY
jgi:LPXTG-motif cell wall-anchored protein